MKIDTGYRPDFVGTFDGVGHCISNLYFTHNGLGMFGTYCSGTVKNLALTGLNITGYRKGAICFDFTGTAEDLFLEGVINASNLNTGLLSGSCSSTPNLRRVSAILSESTNRTDCGILIGSSLITDSSSIKLNNMYAIGGVGLLMSAANDIGVGLFNTFSCATLQTFIDAEKNINAFTSTLWDTTSGFPIMRSAIGKLTKINLQATNDAGTVVTEVAAGSSVNIGIKKYGTKDTHINGQAGFSTITVAEIDGVTFENGVLSVASTVESGTQITLTVTNNLDGSTNTLKLTVG